MAATLLNRTMVRLLNRGIHHKATGLHQILVARRKAILLNRNTREFYLDFDSVFSDCG